MSQILNVEIPDAVAKSLLNMYGPTYGDTLDDRVAHILVDLVNNAGKVAPPPALPPGPTVPRPWNPDDGTFVIC